MKAVIIGTDPRVVGVAAASVRTRWPGATLEFAMNSRRGMRLLKEGQPTVVILSKLGDSNLYDFIQKLRTFSNVPLLVLVNTKDDGGTVAWQEAGADDYFRLPCAPGELTRRIRALVNSSVTSDTTSAISAAPVY